MKLLDKFKPRKKAKCLFIPKNGRAYIKNKTTDGGKILHESGTYCFTSNDIIYINKKPYLFFFEGNPHAITLKYLEPPVLDSEAYNVVLKMEGIKAIQMLDEEQKRQTIMLLAFTAITMIASIAIAGRVFGVI